MMGTRALHVVARVAIRVARPLVAKRLVDVAARAMSPFASLDDAAHAASALGAKGTCLSRALTVAARLPGAEVVIGVASVPEFAAHAWVEMNGVRLLADADRPDLVEVARLGSVTYGKNGR